MTSGIRRNTGLLVSLLVIEPGASHMLGGHSTTDLYIPSPVLEMILSSEQHLSARE